MKQLQSRLEGREAVPKITFNPLDGRIRCYAHIINICSSHIVASVTSTSKSYLANLGVPVGSSHVTCDSDDSDDSDDGSDDGTANNGSSDGDVDHYRDINELQLHESFNAHGDPELDDWFSGFQRDPLRRARQLIRFLRSSDQRREDLQKTIRKGNNQNWFIGTDDDGNTTTIKVPELELLRDVKTRWDSVYLMLARLQYLRPVCLSWQSCVGDELIVYHRRSIGIFKLTV